MAVNSTIDTVGDLIKALQTFDKKSPIAIYQAQTQYVVSQIAKVTVEEKERTVITNDTPAP